MIYKNSNVWKIVREILEISQPTVTATHHLVPGKAAAGPPDRVVGPVVRAVRAEMRKTARLGTNKAARTPTRSLNPTRKRTSASASSRGSHEWSVGNQWVYARLSTHTRPLSVTCTRVPPRSHAIRRVSASSCFFLAATRRVEEKLRAAFEQVGIVGIVGIVGGFNWVQWGVWWERCGIVYFSYGIGIFVKRESWTDEVLDEKFRNDCIYIFEESWGGKEFWKNLNLKIRKLVGSCENVFDEIIYNLWSIKLYYPNQVWNELNRYVPSNDWFLVFSFIKKYIQFLWNMFLAIHFFI